MRCSYLPPSALLQKPLHALHNALQPREPFRELRVELLVRLPLGDARVEVVAVGDGAEGDLGRRCKY